MSSNIYQKYQNTFEQSQIFAGLDKSFIIDCLKHSEIKLFRRGQYLLHQGDKPRYTAFILSGNLITLRSDAHGNEIIIRLLEAGETCIEAILFPHSISSPISVKASRSSEILCIPAPYIEHICLKNNLFSRNLINVLAFYYRRAMQQIDSITMQDAERRLGQYLLQCYLESGHHEHFELSFRKTDIARYLGMSPETFSRTLKNLQKQYINVENHDISLNDQHALCCFCTPESAVNCHLIEKCPSHTITAAVVSKRNPQF